MLGIRKIFGVVALCAMTSAAGAQGPGAAPVLEISIEDPAALPLENARVTVRSTTSGFSVERRSGAEGKVELSPNLEGRYLVLVSADGFADESRYVEWRNESLTLEIELSIAGLREQITVTSGSRIEELQQDSAVKVEAVTRESMMATGYERLTDVLSEIPGVVTRSGSSATTGSEQVRGVGARQVAVLQDGLPMVGARGIKRGDLNLNRQSVGRLERVEVVKGAASSLFGTDAIGGVINMISREPTQPIQANLSLSGGSLGAVDARGDIGTRYKNLTLFLDLEQHRQDAYRLVPGSTNTVGPDLLRNDVFFKVRYAFTPHFTLGFTANGYDNREEGRSFGETGPVNGLYNDSVQNFTIVGDFIPTPTTTLQVRAYSAHYNEDSRLDSLGAPTDPDFANLNERYERLDATVSQQIGGRNLLQSGYEWAQDDYRGVNRLVGDNAGQQITSNDVWLQDKIQLTHFATLDIGGRITHHSLYGTQAVPKAGLVVRLDDNWSVRGSFGRGFRAPDLGQLYYRFANPASFYQVIGNPTLQPETSRSFSAGVDFRARRFRGGVSLFRNDVRNLIDSVSIGFPTTPEELAELLDQYGIPSSFDPLLGRATYIYRNFGKIYTRGFELNAEQSITRNLRVAAAYTYLDARDIETGLGLPQRHKHQGYVRTEYAKPDWGLFTNVRGTFFSKWLLNPATGTQGFGYGIWDFYLAKDVSHGAQMYFSIDNFADSRDQKLALDSPTFDRADYGRTFRVGIRWQLGEE